MQQYPEALERLIRELAKLPGVGKKSGRRLAYHLVKQDKNLVMELAEAIIAAKENLSFCPICFNLAQTKLCQVCSDVTRDPSRILVVENFNDLQLFESLNSYDGLYHVLGGVLNFLEGIGPDKLRFEELFLRAKEPTAKEVIIGLGQSLESDTTALYLVNQLRESGVKVTRLARGIPMGGEIEYTDQITLRQALENRKEYS